MLQVNLFAQHSQIHSIGLKSGIKLPAFYAELFKPYGYFDAGAFQAICADLPVHATKTTVLSNGGLVYDYKLRAHIAERLKVAFPDSRVLFTIRNQLTAVQANYGTAMRNLRPAPAPYSGRHVKFDDWLRYEIAMNYELWLGAFDYENCIKVYEAVYGQGNICVLLMESLKDNFDTYVASLASFLNVDGSETAHLLGQKPKNLRRSRKSVIVKRFREAIPIKISFHKFLPERVRDALRPFYERMILTGKGYSPEYDPELKRLLIEHYRPGNRKLAGRYGLDLARYGYPL